MNRLQIYLTPEQYQNVKEIAYKNNITLSHIFRWCLDEFIGKLDIKDEAKDTTLKLIESNPADPEEKNLFDSEILQFYREFKSDTTLS